MPFPGSLSLILLKLGNPAMDLRPPAIFLIHNYDLAYSPGFIFGIHQNLCPAIKDEDIKIRAAASPLYERCSGLAIRELFAILFEDHSTT